MTTPKELPKFDKNKEFKNPAEMLEYIRNGGKTKSVGKKTRKQYTDPTPKNKPEDIYKTIHLYVRTHDTFTSVLKDARELNRGPDVIVMAHNHKFEQECNPSCRSVE